MSEAKNTPIERPIWGIAVIAAELGITRQALHEAITRKDPVSRLLRRMAPRGRWFAFPSEIHAFLRRCGQEGEEC